MSELDFAVPTNMRFEVWSQALPVIPTDVLLLGVFDEGELASEARLVDTAVRGYLTAIVSRGDFSGRANETLLLPISSGILATRVLLVGLGSRKSYCRRYWRKALETAVARLSRTRITRATVALPRPSAKDLNDYEFGRALAQIVSGAVYRSNALKTGARPISLALEVVLAGPVRVEGGEEARRGLTHGAVIGQAMKLQRDLCNLPANICTPDYLAERARKLARKFPSITVQALNETGIRRARMGCFLAVARGSDVRPRLIILKYRGVDTAQAPIVLVGKGLTFDSGGISLKRSERMDEMKYDMSGAAAVLSAISLAAQLHLPLYLIGLVAACENMPSGHAVKPGDIVTSASGQTVEVLDTDAEGRLVLCDALHYARRFKPAVVVDIATLTGSCVVALGAHHSGVMGNDDEVIQELLAAGIRADDRAWQLPLTRDYQDELNSQVADTTHVAGTAGGASIAGAFLSRFVEGMKWAHLDIAGTAFRSGKEKGSTGRPVPLLADFLIHRAGSQ